LARDAGVEIIGGCCGTTPEHIKAMSLALEAAKERQPVDADRLEKTLGKPWKNIEKPSGDNLSGETSRRRRRRG
ncbi:MAG: homocysteine S-methyltransferase family protein, partial [Proteobacteria bacterium]|nr:homocysteine S-methyltransferase family protein [Pseudomonadota bacterium]